MTLPGVVTTLSEQPPPISAPTDTGVAYVAAEALQGSHTEPAAVESIAQLIAEYGDREPGSMLYDWADTYFREGGNRLQVARIVGPNPVASSFTLVDGSAADTLTVEANSVGVWGDALNVAVLAPIGSGFRLQISHDVDGILETSPDLADKAAAFAWAVGSQFIVLVDEGASEDNPATIAAQALTGGTDDRANVTDTEVTAALNLFERELGPGQVALPGRTSTAHHGLLSVHADARNRMALLDPVNTGTVATLTAAAAASGASVGNRRSQLLAPWATVPGLTGGTIRTVPYSAVQAGILARNDGAGVSPNQAAAGAEFGRARFASGLSQPAFTETQRETLNDAGVTVARIRFGQVQTYGLRSLADPVSDQTWVNFAHARFFMAIIAEGEAVLERHVFGELDGRRVRLKRVEGELTAMFQSPSPFASSVYPLLDPQTREQLDLGYLVDTDTVNDAATAAARELHALIAVRAAEGAEVVELQLVKVPTEGAIG